MYPLPINPTVNILTDADGRIISVASNIDPLPELKVTVTQDRHEFNEEAANKPFNQSPAEVYCGE
jgi:hypothetical protein